MALKYVRPRKDSNGSGNSYDDALNTFAGLTWGSDTYLVDGGTLYETITFGASGARVVGLNPNDMPVIDCESIRPNGVNLNGAASCEVGRIIVLNQQAAAAPNAAVRISGATGLHYVHHVRTQNCRYGLYVNNCPGVRLEDNFVDVGRTDELNIGYGIRVNGAASIGTRIRRNEVVSTRVTPAQFIDLVAFGVAIEVYGGVDTEVDDNVLHAAMCDQFIARASANNLKIRRNVAFGPGMLDGLDVLDSDTALLEFNTVIHPGDVAGHAGPCMAIGDDYGAGVAATNVTVRHNAMWANNRLCMSIRPLGAGFSSVGNRLYRTNGDGDAVVNLNEGGGFVATNMAAWLAEAYVTGDTYGDPLVNQFGVPLVGSPLLTLRTDGVYRRDIRGFQSSKHVGAFGAARLRRT